MCVQAERVLLCAHWLPDFDRAAKPCKRSAKTKCTELPFELVCCAGWGVFDVPVLCPVSLCVLNQRFGFVWQRTLAWCGPCAYECMHGAMLTTECDPISWLNIQGRLSWSIW